MPCSRRSGISLLALAACLLTLESALAQTKPAPKKRAPNPSMAAIKDAPGLPRVLLLGDSISVGYTLPVRAALAGKANVHRAQDNCGPTSKGLEKLDTWLGKAPWDVIHFNFGLHDLKFIEEKQQVPLADYEKNLRQIVARLKQTGAVLVWCSTTPVPEKCTPKRLNSDVLAYNAVAEKIMKENGIAIDDLYSFALPRIKEIQLPDNVHFSGDGSKTLATQVVASIEKGLASRPKK